MSRISRVDLVKRVLDSVNSKSTKRSIKSRSYTLKSNNHKDTVKNLVHRALPNLTFPEDELPKRKKSK